MTRGGKMKTVKDILAILAIGIMAGIIIYECFFILNLFNRTGDNHSIQIELETGEGQTIPFEKLGLVPGDSVTYDLYLSTTDGPTKKVYLEFYEVQDSPLKDFVRVRILVNDEEICDELLGDLMDSGKVDFDTDLSVGSECKVTIIYYMPEEVGNEAANAEAWFDLSITAQFK